MFHAIRRGIFANVSGADTPQRWVRAQPRGNKIDEGCSLSRAEPGDKENRAPGPRFPAMPLARSQAWFRTEPDTQLDMARVPRFHAIAAGFANDSLSLIRL